MGARQLGAADDLTDYYHSYGRPQLDDEDEDVGWYWYDQDGYDDEFEYDDYDADPGYDDPGYDDELGDDDPFGFDRAEPRLVAYGRRVLDEAEWSITTLMATYGVRALQVAIGIIYFWFGGLKLAPGLSPAEDLVLATLNKLLTLVGLTSMPLQLGLILLAFWEVAIGLGFLLDSHRRLVVWALVLHMFSTALPLVVLPEVVWTMFPYGLTLEGQYIVKNLVILGGAAVVVATVRGGYLTPGTRPQHDDRETPGARRLPGEVTEQGPEADVPGGEPSLQAPKVWVVDWDGSLVATYELNDYWRDREPDSGQGTIS